MPTALGFACFKTALGTCGIAWGQAGIVGSQLPEDDAQATRRRMQARFPGAPEVEPPAEVQHAMELVQAMLSGGPADVSDVRLDMTGVPAFHQRVYEASLKLKAGETTTYGEMARQLGEPGAARAVGQALGHNPFAPIVPCHRILAAGGRSGGFSANGGAATKLRMLAIEGAMAQGSLFD
jgi:methylated-DNA-[protein]-cysteine S-methyltransferase